jgi:hypothetical protein
LLWLARPRERTTWNVLDDVPDVEGDFRLRRPREPVQPLGGKGFEFLADLLLRPVLPVVGLACHTEHREVASAWLLQSMPSEILDELGPRLGTAHP